MHKVYSARDIQEAHIVAGMLQAHDIPASVGGHYLQGAIGDMAAFDFASVHVPDPHIDSARALIAEYEGRAPSAAKNLDEADAELPEASIPSSYIWWVVAAFLLILVLSV